MLTETIQAALDRADHELSDDEEPCFGKTPGLEGVWTTGATLAFKQTNRVDPAYRVYPVSSA